MKRYLYQLQDVKAQVMLGPILAERNTIPIFRSILDALMSAEPNNINKYPEDFVVLELGTYEDTDGTIEGHEYPFVVGTVKELLDSMRRRQAEPEPQQ